MVQRVGSTVFRARQTGSNRERRKGIGGIYSAKLEHDELLALWSADNMDNPGTEGSTDGWVYGVPGSTQLPGPTGKGDS